jgi:peptide/nickel transport system substrate-binding protein
MKILKAWAYGLMMVLACVCIAGCGNTGSTASTNGKTLTYASPDYTTINSILNTHDELPDIIFSGLMTYDAKGNPIPDLAASYKFDPASLTYTFHLRDNVKWHDGQPFTAADVKFTLDTLTHNKNWKQQSPIIIKKSKRSRLWTIILLRSPYPGPMRQCSTI